MRVQVAVPDERRAILSREQPGRALADDLLHPGRLLDFGPRGSGRLGQLRRLPNGLRGLLRLLLGRSLRGFGLSLAVGLRYSAFYRCPHVALDDAALRA